MYRRKSWSASTTSTRLAPSGFGFFMFMRAECRKNDSINIANVEFFTSYRSISVKKTPYELPFGQVCVPSVDHDRTDLSQHWTQSGLELRRMGRRVRRFLQHKPNHIKERWLKE